MHWWFLWSSAVHLWLPLCSRALFGKCICDFSDVPKACQENAVVTEPLFRSHVRKMQLSLLFCSKTMSGESICHFSFVRKPCQENTFVTSLLFQNHVKRKHLSLLFQSHVKRKHLSLLFCSKAMSGEFIGDLSFVAMPCQETRRRSWKDRGSVRQWTKKQKEDKQEQSFESVPSC